MLLTEVFDAVGKLDVVNLTPKAKVPHMLQIKAPDAENLVIRFCNYAAKGDAVKQVKPGDKFMQIQIMQLSPKGNLQVLKHGLGSDPIGVMNVITDETLEMMKKFKIDGALLRFPTKSMAGKAKTIGKIAARLLQTRGGGRFVVMPELLEHAGKYTYIMMYRKSTGITGIAGLEIDPDLYTITKTGIGDVVISKKTGDKVTKTEAIAATIIAKEDKRPMASATHFKIDRATLVKSFNMANSIEDKDPSAQFRPVEEILNIVPKEFTSYSMAAKDFMGAERAIIQKYGDDLNLEQVEIDAMIMSMDGKSANSLEALNKYAQIISDFYIDQQYDGAYDTLDHIPDSHPGKEDMVKDMAIRRAEHSIQMAMYNYQQLLERKFNKQYKNFVELSLGHADRESQKAVEYYCAEGYMRINGVLLGNSHMDAEARDSIRAMDKAFETASIKIPKGMTLYRGQNSDSWVSKAAIENKAFYFANFVSTSAKPIMYAAQLGSTSGISIDRKEIEADEITIVDKTDEAIYFGFAITETHVPAIFPGDWSEHLDECEFILPRGTVLKFNKIYHAGSIGKKTNIFVDCHAVGVDALNEEIVYDGDHLMETGEIRPMAFSSFVKKSKEPQVTKSETFSLLAGLMNFEGISKKFSQ